MDKKNIERLISFEPTFDTDAKWWGPEIIRPVYENNLWIDNDILTNAIYETIDSTFPLKTTVSYLMKKCGVPERNIKIKTVQPDDEYDESSVVDIFIECAGYPEEALKIKIKGINQVMQQCGYRFSKFVSDRTLSDGTVVPTEDYVCMMFIPKFSNDITREVFDSQVRLLHITPTCNRKRIEKYGLVPRSKNRGFSYPERIHFLWPVQKEDIFYGMIKDLYIMMKSGRPDINDKYEKMLCEVLGVKDGQVPNISDDISFDVWGVNKRLLQEPEDLYVNKFNNEQDRIKKGRFHANKDGVRFFRDPSYQFGVYTYDNIYPDSLLLSFPDINISKVRRYFKWKHGIEF